LANNDYTTTIAALIGRCPKILRLLPYHAIFRTQDKPKGYEQIHKKTWSYLQVLIAGQDSNLRPPGYGPNQQVFQKSRIFR